MFRIKLPTKRVFQIFPTLRTDGMAPFCNLFMERPSYNQARAELQTAEASRVDG